MRRSYSESGRLAAASGIPTFEDKVAQRAIVMLLEAIYEQDFLPCSYGFRPGRSAHDAVLFAHVAHDAGHAVGAGYRHQAIFRHHPA
ncbi:hypothetical protein ACFQY5_41590 [Paeniroseomonas aquatica]|uniref:hypothetical protein n=1 Tax=Paeniroseomonas aquatica TaxID=373043 RepID=UPI00360B8B33